LVHLREGQVVGGTVIWTSPRGKTFTTVPASRLPKSLTTLAPAGQGCRVRGLLIALSLLAGQASQTALHGYPAARYVTLALIALSALCFGAATWLGHRR
jgi:hypothetical protein